MKKLSIVIGIVILILIGFVFFYKSCPSVLGPRAADGSFPSYRPRSDFGQFIFKVQQALHLEKDCPI